MPHSLSYCRRTMSELHDEDETVRMRVRLHPFPGRPDAVQLAPAR
ncbi:hypothetical protein SAVIM338S_07217 [Streptomyces avidinii]